jgi:hypothetical protein
MPELLKLSLKRNISFQDSEPELMLPHWAAKGKEKKQVKDPPCSLRARSLAEDSHHVIPSASFGGEVYCEKSFMGRRM